MSAAAESFLAEMFPSHPHRARVLRECGGDIERAVQRLLADEATNPTTDATTAASSVAAAAAAAERAVVELSLNPSLPSPSAPLAEVNVSLEPASQGDSNDDLHSPWMPSIDQSPVPSLNPASLPMPLPAALEPAADDEKQPEYEQMQPNQVFNTLDEQMQQLQREEEAAEEEEERKGQDMIDLASDAPDDSDLHAAFDALHGLLSASPAVSPSTYLTTLRTLLHAVSNVLLHPLTEKFRLLPVGHAKFRARVGGVPEDPRLLAAAQAALEALGFMNVATGATNPSEEAFLLMTAESRDEDRLQRGRTMIEQEMLITQNRIGAAPVPVAAAAAAAAVPATPVAPAALPAAWTSVGAAAAAASASTSAAAAAAAPSSSSSSSAAAILTGPPSDAAVAAALRWAGAPPSAAATAASNPALAPTPTSSLLYMPLSQLKKQYKRKPASSAPAKTAKLTREQMADKINQRLSGKPAEAAAAASSAPAPVQQQRAGRIMDLQQTAKLRSEIDAVRRAKHSQWTSTAQSRKRVFTVDDLAKMEENDIKARAVFGAAGAPAAAAAAGGAGAGGGAGSKFRTVADFGAGSPADCLALGKEMLRLTNAFRAREGKRALAWHQSLCDIGMVHSKRMGLKQVAFGHDGAKQRFAAYPFPVRSAAENVAWSAGHPNVAACHVDGWIASPGHRKNMLAHHTWCAIAVWKNPEGAYYSTQLFGLG